MPGSTTQVRFSTSSERIAVQVLGEVDDYPSLTVWPHCEVPPPRGVTISPRRGDRKRLQRLVDGAGHHDAGGMIW
jgi:hypothetical protein